MNTAASVGFQFQTANQAYAIPISRALTLARQMVAGRASATVHIGSTPFLGVSISQGANGLIVQSVVPGSPADLAGIVAGDTLTSLDGQPVGSYNALSALILLHSAGDTVTLQWLDQSGVAQTAGVQTVAGPPQ